MWEGSAGVGGECRCGKGVQVWEGSVGVGRECRWGKCRCGCVDVGGV